MVVTQEVIDKCIEKIRDVNNEIFRPKTQFAQWPDDDWFSIGEGWDLNLWTIKEPPKATQGATLYPVIDGKTMTEEFYTIYSLPIKPGGAPDYSSMRLVLTVDMLTTEEQ